MDEDNPYATIACALKYNVEDIKTSGSSDTAESEHFFITHIRVTDVVSCLRRMPVGFYVSVRIDEKIGETTNKPVLVGNDSVEWDVEILLPPKRLSSVCFAVYASFELGPRLGQGELLYQFSLTVGSILDHDERLQPIKPFLQRDVIFPTCSSLRILTKRRICNAYEFVTLLNPPKSDTANQLGQLTDAGHSALASYRWSQNEKHLDDAIRDFQRACEMCPPNHPNRSPALFNLASATLIVYQVHEHSLGLHAPITMYQEALQLRGVGHPDYFATALHLAFALLARYWKEENEADLIEANDLLCRVAKLSPVESYTHRAAHIALQMAMIPVSYKSGFLSNPGKSLFSFGRPTRDFPDPGKSISVTNEALPFGTDIHPKNPVLLKTLSALLSQFLDQPNDILDFDRLTSMYEKAVRLNPNHDANKPNELNNLGRFLLCGFERFGNLANLDKSTSVFEETVQLTPDENPTKPVFLDNLGRSLFRRFCCRGDLADINKAIQMKREAVRLTPNGDPFRLLARKHTLGNSLLRRFELSGNLSDVDESILLFEDVTRLTSDEDPDKPHRLNCLGSALLRRYEQFGDPVDIEWSISMLEKAANLVSHDHPSRPC